jgi:ABC-type nickel/cobalt efflux system permease component RcnA
MPVFLQGAAQTVPEDQRVGLQQAPLDPATKKLKAVKAEVEKYQNRLKYTSTSLIAIGAIGMAVSFYKMMTAGRHADHMINGHPHHGPHHPHNRTEGRPDHHPHPHNGTDGPRYVTHE